MPEMTTLGSIAKKFGGRIQTGPFGSQLHAEQYVSSGVPVIMPANMKNGRIDHSSEIAFISAEDASQLGRHISFPGDILYSRRGDITQRVYVHESDGPVFCGTGSLKVDLGNAEESFKKYISYQLALPETHQWLTMHAVGATMLNLNTKILEQLPIRVSDAKQSRAISEVLSSLDDKIEANTKLAHTADELASALYLAAASGLGTVPLLSVTMPILGGTPPRSNDDYWIGSNNWISAKDITGAVNAFVVDTIEHISDAAARNTRAKPLPKGSVVITARGTVGAIARLANQSSFNQSCYGFVPSKDFPSSVLYQALKYSVTELQRVAYGSVFDSITTQTLESIRVPEITAVARPDLVSELENLEQQVLVLVKENNRLSDLRDYLLPRLMSGKISVREATTML